MARAVTVGGLKTRTRERADAVGDTSWVTDAELSRYLDVGYCELVDLLVAADVHQFETSTTFVTDGTNDSYALPTDFYKLLGLDYLWSTGRYVSVPVVTFGERNRYDALYVSSLYGSYAAGYRLVGNAVKLYPPQMPAGQVYRVSYAPTGANFAALADSATVDGIDGWDELLVIVAAMKMARKEGDSVGLRELAQDKKEIVDRIAQMGVDRQPVQSIAPDYDDGPLDGRWGVDRYRWRDR